MDKDLFSALAMLIWFIAIHVLMFVGEEFWMGLVFGIPFTVLGVLWTRRQLGYP